MKIKQLSVFLENKPGKLSQPCGVLAKAGINIVTLSLADTNQFGIMRVIVKDWDKAEQALKDAGFVVRLTEVTAIKVADKPGGLESVLEVIDTADLNVEYMYAFASCKGGEAVIVFRFEDPDAAIAQLGERGIKFLDAETLFGDCSNW